MLYVMFCVVFEGERGISVEGEEALMFRSCHLSWVSSANRKYLVWELNKNWREYSF
jgi:hypothetical protein